MFEPQSGEWLLNKHSIYKELRNSQTAYWSEKYNLYVITRYDDVYYILSNPEIFSSAKGNLPFDYPPRFGHTLGTSDNPLHNEYKNLLKNAYTKDNIKRVVDLFSKKAIEFFEGQTQLNVSEITKELASWAIAEILNFPLEKDYVKNIISETQECSQHAVYSDHIENFEERSRNLSIKYRVLDNVIYGNTPSKGPGVYNEFLKTFNDPILKDQSKTSLFTGAPTISGAGSLISALQFLTLDLYRENKLDILLKDKSLIPFAINESLRFNTPTGRFTRTTTEKITIHGVDLKPGDRVAVCLDSANRDPNKFTDPDKFDIHRDTSGHLAWGHGVHSCIALAISKELMIAYLEILLDKIGRYKIVTKDFDLIYKVSATGTGDTMINIILNKE